MIRHAVGLLLCSAQAAVKDTPNQDNFSITRFPSGHTLALVCDGHGKKGHSSSLIREEGAEAAELMLSGHQAATRAVQTIPFLLLQLGLNEEAAVEKARLRAAM
ncbi:ANK1 [Symbiodinium natans]|uniref:ANK1 protein n=1 Tax=Symbiodinium natans TaxID=878477 RepID=A0A812SKP8_9DINO|nr:ANK1 [Symbiodinium natans]